MPLFIEFPRNVKRHVPLSILIDDPLNAAVVAVCDPDKFIELNSQFK